jgi:uncharacterized membrane protein (UPF0127 family)
MSTRVVSKTRGTLICRQTEIASNSFTRMRGLLGRAGLEQGTGMLFLGESSIHSAFMRFHFDAVFMDAEMRVLKLAERIPPWRAQSARGARNILELAAGEITRLGLQVGDQLSVVEVADPIDPAPVPDAVTDTDQP